MCKRCYCNRPEFLADDTTKILNNLSKDYDGIKVVNWKECKDVIDSIKEAG